MPFRHPTPAEYALGHCAHQAINTFEHVAGRFSIRRCEYADDVSSQLLRLLLYGFSRVKIYDWYTVGSSSKDHLRDLLEAGGNPSSFGESE